MKRSVPNTFPRPVDQDYPTIGGISIEHWELQMRSLAGDDREVRGMVEGETASGRRTLNTRALDPYVSQLFRAKIDIRREQDAVEFYLRRELRIALDGQEAFERALWGEQ